MAECAIKGPIVLNTPKRFGHFALMKLFVSYTSADAPWAHWIGWTLIQGAHEVFVHEWDIGPGENIPEWMNRRMAESDKFIGIFSPSYLQAEYSQSEMHGAYWTDATGRKGFLVPILVRPCAELPPLVQPLKRLRVYDLPADDARRQLLKFLEAPNSPSAEPPFPGQSSSSPGDFNGARSDQKPEACQ